MHTQTTTMTAQQLKDIIKGTTHVYCLVAGTTEEWLPVDAHKFWDNVLSMPEHLTKSRTYEVIYHPYTEEVYIHTVNIRTKETTGEVLGRLLMPS